MNGPGGGAGAVSWSVTYQQQGYDTTPGAPVRAGVTVGFVVNGRTQSSVFIPQDEYTPDNVRAKVAAAAARVAAVDALTDAG